MNTNSNRLEHTGSAFNAGSRAFAKHAGTIDVGHAPQQHQLVTGTGTFLARDGMFVSLGRKVDAFCPQSEIGDAVTGKESLFLVLSNGGDEEMPTVSRAKALVWQELAGKQSSSEAIFVRVLEIVRLHSTDTAIGLKVKIEEGLANGLLGYVPLEGELRRLNLANLIGQPLSVVITKLAPDKQAKFKQITFSHERVFAENTAPAIASLSSGEMIEGQVLKFIKAAKKDEHPSVLVLLKKDGFSSVGMIHKSELPGFPQRKATDFLKVGEQISVQVLRASTAKKTVALGMRTQERAQFLAGIEPGHVVSGRVDRSLEFGYFIDLGAGIEGLLRTHELLRSYGKNEALKIGDQVKVVVLVNDQKTGKLLLGRRQLRAAHLAD